MKRYFFFVLLFVVVFPLFANWNIGTVVDDFGDPTGECFLYTISEGSFSNSATSNSNAVLRISISFSDLYDFPVPIIRIEPHEYAFTNPVQVPLDRSMVLKVKLEDNSVNTFNIKEDKVKSSWEFGGSWNTLYGTYSKTAASADHLINYLINNKRIKCNIVLSNANFVFTIDCSDFNEMLGVFIDKTGKNKFSKDVWIQKDDVFDVLYTDCVYGNKDKYLVKVEHDFLGFFRFYGGTDYNNDGIYYITDFSYDKAVFSTSKKKYTCTSTGTFGKGSKDFKKVLNVIKSDDFFSLELVTKYSSYFMSFNSKEFIDIVGI